MLTQAPFISPAEGLSPQWGTDLAVLRQLQSYVVRLVGQAQLELDQADEFAILYSRYRNLTLNTLTTDQRSLRIKILEPQKLAEIQQIYFVGFFGTRRKGADPTVVEQIGELDRLMMDSLDSYPFILSYNSIELPDRYNYANLVLFSQVEGLQQWKTTQYHTKAAQQLSPLYYERVRIHQGQLTQGLSSPLALLKTNHYEFSSTDCYCQA